MHASRAHAQAGRGGHARGPRGVRLHGRSAGAELPRLILESRSRSRSCGAPPDRREARFAGAVAPSETRLAHTVGPVLEGVARGLQGTDTAVLLSDRTARILRRWTGDSRMATLMDRVHAAEGFVLAEEQVGTNGAGTPLEAGEAVAVVGTAHYNEQAPLARRRLLEQALLGLLHHVAGRLGGRVLAPRGRCSTASPTTAATTWTRSTSSPPIRPGSTSSGAAAREPCSCAPACRRGAARRH